MTDKEQEPVAWMYTNEKGQTFFVESAANPFENGGIPLYASLPRLPPAPVAHAGIMIWNGDLKITRTFDEYLMTNLRNPIGMLKSEIDRMLKDLVKV